MRDVNFCTCQFRCAMLMRESIDRNLCVCGRGIYGVKTCQRKCLICYENMLFFQYKVKGLGGNVMGCVHGTAWFSIAHVWIFTEWSMNHLEVHLRCLLDCRRVSSLHALVCQHARWVGRNTYMFLNAAVVPVLFARESKGNTKRKWHRILRDLHIYGDNSQLSIASCPVLYNVATCAFRYMC